LLLSIFISLQLSVPFPEFEFHKIGEFEKRMGHTALIDLDEDSDGDINICSKPWHGNVHVYLENKLIP
jgi:hypothetical protein